MQVYILFVCNGNKNYYIFSSIPEDGRRKVYAEKLAKAKAEEEARLAAEKAQEAAAAAKKLEEEVEKLSKQEAQAASLAEEAQEKAEAAGASFDNLFNKAKDIGSGFSWKKLSSASSAEEAQEKTEAAGASSDNLFNKAKDIGSGFSWEKLSSQLAATTNQKPQVTPKVQVATVRGQAKARQLPSLKAVVKQKSPASKPKVQPKSSPKGKQTEANSPEVRKVFGGLFKQETIYIDDD